MRTILLIEDTADLAEQLADILRMENFHVEVARNGEEALDLLLGGFTPHLIITDLLMPGIDGFTVIERVKSMPRLASIPIIILSAKGDQSSIEKASGLNVSGFLHKPCSPEILLNVIERFS
jgi:CheY-like chemotaxis protein